MIVLLEHWLCHYDLYKLDELNSDFHNLGKTNPRLSDTSDIGGRGCSVLVSCGASHHIDVFPIRDILTKRIRGIYKDQESE